MSNRLELESDGELPEELAEMLKLDGDSNLEDQNLSEELEESSRFFFMAWWASFWKWLVVQKKVKTANSATLIIEKTQKRVEASDKEVRKEIQEIKKVFQFINKVVNKSTFLFENAVLYRSDCLVIKLKINESFGDKNAEILISHISGDKSIFCSKRSPLINHKALSKVIERRMESLVRDGITAKDIAEGFSKIISDLEANFFE